MTKQQPRLQTKKTADLLHALGQPARLRILLTIGEHEACVCHLESLLGYRQAYIYQHLMALREAGILHSRREGRYIFYRLQDAALLELIRRAWELAISDIPFPELRIDATEFCACPDCETPFTGLLHSEAALESNGFEV